MGKDFSKVKVSFMAHCAKYLYRRSYENNMKVCVFDSA